MLSRPSSQRRFEGVRQLIAGLAVALAGIAIAIGGVELAGLSLSASPILGAVIFAVGLLWAAAFVREAFGRGKRGT